MRRTFSCFLILATMVLAGCSQDIIYREDVKNPRTDWSGDDFVRYNGYDLVAGTMQASAVTYKHPKHDAKLSLVGAVSDGDEVISCLCVHRSELDVSHLSSRT